jgi:malate dehydrogenase (oxaloacetate-decarboxylating)
VQLEDFGTLNASRLLEDNRDRYRCFDGNIQGTGAVVTAGVMAALDRVGRRLVDQRFVIAGAGEARIGVVRALVAAMIAESVREATRPGARPSKPSRGPRATRSS